MSGANHRPASTWIVVPARNESEVIGGVVAELRAGGWPVVVIDDASIDETATRARTAGARVVSHGVNLGQGAALQTGIEFAIRKGAEAIVTFDGDGQHDAADIPRLVSALSEADVALGSRFLGSAVGATPGRMVFLRLAVRVSNILSGLDLTDAHCGIRAFRAEAAERLTIRQNGMAHASEILRRIRDLGLRVVEVPVTIRYTEYSRRKGQSGLSAVRILLDVFFGSRD